MDAKHYSPFGATLRQFREAAALSQMELAERAGLSFRGISDLERGVRTRPRLETVRMLADGLELGESERRELLNARNFARQMSRFTSGYIPPKLPEPLTLFIGREREIRDVRRLLQHGQARLVTLTGPGGVGKTRVAIEIARRLADAFEDGAIFVDLSPVRNRELGLSAIASRLGVSKQAGSDMRESLGVALQGRHLLLVLDNLEQVIDVAEDIAWLITTCPDLTVIATSRVLLLIAAEHVLQLDSLAVPTHDDVDSIADVDSVSMFVARATGADHRFSLNRENASEVAAIVKRLQGMPLAIELAAARLRLFSISELLNRLDSQLPLLTGGARDAPQRHRTMRDTIAWSYHLLSPTEQMVFRTLANFPDGCSWETAVAVLSVENRLCEKETLDAVEVLVDSSMLRRHNGTDGEARFRMLQTVREFGLEQLVATGEETVSRMAVHHSWSVPLARRAEYLMADPDEVYWLNRLAAEYQNLREHLAWLIENSHVNDALDISGSLATFRILRWHLDEGRLELEMLLAHPHGQEQTLERIRGLIGLGLICIHQGDFARAIDVSDSGLMLTRELGELRHLALALNIHSISLFYCGRIAEAESFYLEQAAVTESIQDSFFIASTFHGRAAIADHRGQLEQSRMLLEEALELCQSAGHVWGTALCKHNLGYQCIRSGALDEAERLVLEAQQLFSEIEGRGDSPGLYLTLADIARLRNDHAESALMLERAFALARDNGNILDIAYTQLGLARTSAHSGDLVTAKEHAYLAMQWYERSGSATQVVLSLDVLSDIAVLANEAVRAAWCIGAVDYVLEKHGMHRTEIEIAENQARIEKILAQSGKEEWRLHYDRGHSMSMEEVLAEVRSWHS